MLLVRLCCRCGDSTLPAKLSSPSRMRSVLCESDKACGGATTSQTALDRTEHSISSSRTAVVSSDCPLISRPGPVPDQRVQSGADGCAFCRPEM